MAVYDPSSQQIDRERFWRIVLGVLEHVFDSDPAGVDSLRRELSARPSEEEALFYHAEPLDVAFDLSNADALTDKHIEKYLDFRSRHP